MVSPPAPVGLRAVIATRIASPGLAWLGLTLTPAESAVP